MDALKQQLLRVQQQLAGLTASQKMLTASLLVIMVMTLFYWSRFASTTEMEAVVDRPLTAEEMTSLKATLEGRGVKYQLQGDKLLVPADKKFELQADLSFNQKLPQVSDTMFDDALNAANLMDTPATRDQRLQVARQRWLSAIMTRWPGVKAAAVMISGEKKLGVLHNAEATATVDIQLKNDTKDVRRLVEAARSFVAQSQAGLEAKNVGVIINGHSFKADDPDESFGGSDVLTARTNSEQRYIAKIETQLSYISGVRATVSVDLVTSKKVTNKHTVDPKGKVEALQTQRTTSEETSQPQASAEPGTIPNVGVAGDQPAAPASTSTKETTETTNNTDLSYENVWMQTGLGDSVPVAAAVRIPESYFRREWKARHSKSAADPTDDDIKQLVDTETPRIRDDVRSATNIVDDKKISVYTYFDLEPAGPADDTAGGALAAIPVGVGFGAKEIAIGALAVVSLFMVSMMVRKSAPQPVMASVPMPVPMAEPGNPLLGGHDLAGEVAEATMTMAGHELSEEALEAKQVIEQVGSMVKDNPEVAANLVKRWLNQD